MLNNKRSRSTAEIESRKVHTSDHAYGFIDRGGPHLSGTTRVQLASAAVNPEVSSETPKRDYVQCLIAQEIIRRYQKHSYHVLQETVEKVLSDLFISYNAKVNGGLKIASFWFVETVLSNMAKKGTLQELFY